MTMPVPSADGRSLNPAMKQTEQTNESIEHETARQIDNEPSLLGIWSDADDVVKNRLVGALVWVLILLWFVPGWYSDPAYQQQAKHEQTNHHQAIVVKPLVKPPEVVAEEQAKAAQAAKEKRAQEEQERQARLQREQRAQQAVADLKAAQQQKPESEGLKSAMPPKPLSNVQAKESNKVYIAKLATFEDKRLLDAALKKAEKAGYRLEVKNYPKTVDGRTYLQFSLRTQMYDSYDKAEKAKQNLDKILRLKGTYVQSIDLKSQD